MLSSNLISKADPIKQPALGKNNFGCWDLGAQGGSCYKHFFMEREEAVSLLTNPFWARSFSRWLMAEKTRWWFIWSHLTWEPQLPWSCESNPINPLSLMPLSWGTVWGGVASRTPTGLGLASGKCQESDELSVPPNKGKGFLVKCMCVCERDMEEECGSLLFLINSFH